MISRLNIENLILIEKSTISFGAHLNILTGETGSGKSVILAALALIMGERADLGLIGKWGETAIVEAQTEDHLIRREIHSSGKNRCFLDSHPVTLSFLKQFIGNQIEIVDQNTSQKLFSQEFQRGKLDLFGGLSAIADQLFDSFHEEVKLREKLAELKLRDQNHERDLQWAKENLKLIEEIDWKENEEERLSQEQEKLHSLGQLIGSIEKIVSTLTENPFLKQVVHQLQATLRLDPTLGPIVTSMKNSSLELDEAERGLRSYLNRLEELDPSRLNLIDTRIAAIESLKKRFGSTHAEIEKKKQSCQELINSQSERGVEIETVCKLLGESEEKNTTLAEILTLKRKSSSLLFSKAVLSELKTLNLPSAQFVVSIEKQPLSSHGYDSIQFLFSANPGHMPAPLDQCASGGELSRLLFAIQTVLAEKEKSRCLIFDEIDSNVGGYTASILGEKLKLLAAHRQIIAVTHFAQVARFATDHFCVSKTKGSIELGHLSLNEREKEYLRMSGELK